MISDGYAGAGRGRPWEQREPWATGPPAGMAGEIEYRSSGDDRGGGYARLADEADSAVSYGVESYLRAVDSELERARAGLPAGGDVVALVFANQLMARELTSRQLAALIQERRELGRRQLEDLELRLVEAQERRPVALRYPIGGEDRARMDADRQIQELERQRRALELALWKDTLELRRVLLDERRERDATARRLTYLSGLGSLLSPPPRYADDDQTEHAWPAGDAAVGSLPGSHAAGSGAVYDRLVWPGGLDRVQPLEDDGRD